MEPSQTIPGGAYQLAGGAWVNANGEALSDEQIAAFKALQAERKAGPMPADVPDALAAAGFDTPDKIAAASDDELLAIPGVGPATLKKLRAG